MGGNIYLCALCRYAILGNHDYGDKCYDEPPGCYVYSGDSFYSPLHQVPHFCASTPHPVGVPQGLQVQQYASQHNHEKAAQIACDALSCAGLEAKKGILQTLAEKNPLLF